MRDRGVYRVDDASGKILDYFLNTAPVLPYLPAGSSFYKVARKGGLGEASPVNFTGTIIFRENVSLLVDSGFEPKRTSLRYYRGKLVESDTTRSDL